MEVIDKKEKELKILKLIILERNMVDCFRKLAKEFSNSKLKKLIEKARSNNKITLDEFLALMKIYSLKSFENHINFVDIKLGYFIKELKFREIK